MFIDRRTLRVAAAFVGAFVIFAAVFGGSSNARAQPPEPGGLLGTVESGPPGRVAGHVGAARARYVSVDVARLAGPGAAPGSTTSAHDVRVELFDGAFITAPRTRIDFGADGSYVWHGEAAGPADGRVTVAVRDGFASGTIVRAGATYQLFHVEGGVHELVEIDPGRMPRSLEPLFASPEGGDTAPMDEKGLRTKADAEGDRGQSSSAPDRAASTDGADAILDDPGDVIDVMVVYTQAARSAQGGTSAMLAMIDLAVAETNQAYSNSDISTSINLAHAQEVSYTESGNFSTDLARLQDTNDGYMDGVHTLRNTHHADVVTLITNSTAYCGIAYVMQTLSNGFAPWAFNVVARTCATGYYSFGHEIGHNQGSMHDRANSGGNQGVYPYGYGYRSPARTFRTIMAYNCTGGGCPRVLHFSNPDVSYSGEPTGIDHDSDPANSAENQRSINNTAYTVANFRDAPDPPPAAPSDLTANASGTTISLAWTDNADDEDGFRIVRADGGVGNWNVIASVPADTTTYADGGLPNSTTFDYRVYAYNAAGDSGYSNVASATTGAPGAAIDRVANGETTVGGTITAGDYTDTHADDGDVESIRENLTDGPPESRVSWLEHHWTIDVAAGESVTLHLKAWMDGSVDGDTFRFAYSTGGAFTDMFTVSNTAPDGYQSYALPPSTSGQIAVRVMDTNREPGHRQVDTITIDHLYVRSESAGGGGSPPAAPSDLAATPISSSEVDLAWTDNASNETGFEIERRADGGSWGQIATPGPNATSYSDSGLSPDTAYDYRVRATNDDGESEWSNIASATTPPAEPITLSATAHWLRGVHVAQLNWSGAVGSNVDIERDGVVVATTPNDGAHFDYIGGMGSASYDYRVCEEASTTECSEVVEVNF